MQKLFIVLVLMFGVSLATTPRRSRPNVASSEKIFEEVFRRPLSPKYEGVERQGLPVAVYVARTTSELDYANPVSFNEVVVNEGNAWNSSTNKLTLPTSGVYFFHLNAGAYPNSPVNMDLLIGEDNYVDVLRRSTFHTGADTLGRGYIRPVVEGETVYVSNALGFPLYSDSGRQTSLTIISLEEYLEDSPIIFGASNVSPFNDLGLLNFDTEDVNLGGAFDYTTGTFIAPSAGTYFFTLSSGLASGQQLRLEIVHSGGKKVNLWRKSDQHNDTDTMYTSCLLDLALGDTISVNLTRGEAFSDFSRQTFFGGFRYNPILVEQAAWSVASTSPSFGVDPLTFDTINVNIDGIFNTSDSIVYISKPGVYYVSYTVSAMVLAPMDVFLVRGRSRVEANIYREIPYHNDADDCIGQTLMLRLFAGNTLRIVVRDGSGVMGSTSPMQVLFSGFLIAP